MVGESREEEEPKGEAMVVFSGGAIMYSFGNALLCSTTPPFFKSLTILAIAYFSTTKWISTLCLVSFSHTTLDEILLIDESDDDEVVKTEMKEEQEGDP